MVAKKPVSVRAVLEDVRAGRSKEEIMSRHGLSIRGLKSLFMKMTAAGYLSKEDVDSYRKPPTRNGKRRVSAKEVLGDIKIGLTDAALMKKYRLSVKGLDALFSRLLRENLVSEGDLYTRGSQLHGTVDIIPSRSDRKPSPNHNRKRQPRPVFRFLCPQCRSREILDYDVCPRCGFRVAEFNVKQASGGQEITEAKEEKPQDVKEDVSQQCARADSEVELNMNGDMTVLRKAFELGVLSAAEFAKKREELLLWDQNGPASRALKKLLKKGLVTEEEFEVKSNELSERSAKYARLKEAFEKGSMSEGEFDRRRAVLLGAEQPVHRPEKLPESSNPGPEVHDKPSTPSPPQREAADFALRPGERLLISEELIFSPWSLSVYGRMAVTNQRLLFRPHGWSVWLAAIESAGIAWLARKVTREPLELSIPRIQSVTRTSFLGMFNGLALRMRSGLEHRFLFSRKTNQGGEKLLAMVEGLLAKR
jgi:hypothetical protein